MRRAAPRFDHVSVFVVALVVRLVYLAESSDSPIFRIPILDEDLYHRLAVELRAEGRAGEALFFQSPLYPAFLSGVYWLVGESPVPPKVLQMFVDAGSAWLVAVFGARLFSRRVGKLAGFTAAFYAPHIFYAGQLLSTSFVVFATLVFLVLLERVDRQPSWQRLLGLGTVGAVAALAHPLLVPATIGLGVLFFVRLAWRGAWTPEGTRWAAAWLLGSAVVFVPAALAQEAAASSLGTLPTSGGLNFYIGNNPNRCTTISTRGGYGWEKLLKEPFERDPTLPYTDASVSSYYYKRSWEFIRDSPGAFLKGLGLKTLQLVQSQEIPRTFDVYVFRDWSRVLELLVFRIGPFGFPFGVLLPLGVYGALSRRREIPWFLFWFVLFYCLALIGVFVASRYRAPLVPVLALFAAVGVETLLERRSARDAGRRSRGRSTKVSNQSSWADRLPKAGAFGAFVLSLLPTIDCETSKNLKAEVLQAVGGKELEAGRLDRAEELLHKAVELDPSYGEAHYNYGLVRAQRGEAADALFHFERTLEIYPGHPMAMRNSGAMLLKLGQIELAHTAFVAAERRGAVDADEFAGIGLRLLSEEQPGALMFLMSAVQKETSKVEAYVTLGAIAAERGEVESAKRIYENGIKTHSDFAYFYFALAELEARSGDFERALATLEPLRVRQPNDPRVKEALERYRRRELAKPATGSMGSEVR